MRKEGGQRGRRKRKIAKEVGGGEGEVEKVTRGKGEGHKVEKRERTEEVKVDKDEVKVEKEEIKVEKEKR